MFQLLFLVTGEEAHQRTGMLMRAECQQEAPYLVLKQNDKRQHAHTDQLVEDGTEQFHLQHLRYHQPYQDNTRIPVNTFIEPEAFISLYV